MKNGSAVIFSLVSWRCPANTVSIFHLMTDDCINLDEPISDIGVLVNRGVTNTGTKLGT